MHARKHYLIHKKFQVDFIIKVLLAMLTPVVVCTLFFLSYLIFRADPSVKLDFAPGVLDFLPTILLRLVPVCFAAIVFSVFFSHRIAGPVKKMSRVMSRMADGEPTAAIKLRKNDYFHNMAIKINKLSEHVRTNYSESGN